MNSQEIDPRTKEIINVNPEIYGINREQYLRRVTKILRYIPGAGVRSIIKRMLWEIHDIRKERSIFIENKGRRFLPRYNFAPKEPGTYNELYYGQPAAERYMRHIRNGKNNINSK